MASLKNSTVLWSFYCSPVNVPYKTFLGYEIKKNWTERKGVYPPLNPPVVPVVVATSFDMFLPIV